MNTLLEQLHDIEGLDPIPWWPLSIGWWVMIAAGVCAICAIFLLIFFRIAYKRSWRNDTFRKLSLLEKDLSDATARETVISLSEYLRRIALRRFARQECAGLTGRKWLKWLNAHDPKQFDWEKKGALLIEVPYAPVSANLSVSEIREIIQAVKNWVR
ncbi:MAG: DUF4381 domain-containing protein [Candidatus Protochlamydia sp.]|nr:DUF4381 domain-containing protein [Candidatus Protochlamydia sp.]